MRRSGRVAACVVARVQRFVAREGLALTCLTLCSACAVPPAETSAPAAVPRPSHTISFGEGKLGFDGRTIDFPPTPDSLVSLLGPPSRTRERIDTWDDLGLHSYRGKGDLLVVEIDVSLCRRDYPFIPHERFTGRVEVPAGSLDAGATTAELRAAGLRNSASMETWWRQNVGRCSIGALWDGQLIGIYLGWRGPDPHHVTGPRLREDELFVAKARDYDFPFDETLREVSHSGNVSTVSIEGASSQGSVGRSFFCVGAMGELARRRGFAYVVTLDGGSDMIVGFTNDEEPNIALEFPEHFVPGRAYDVMAADFIFDLLPNWPDGGKAAQSPAADDP